MDVLLIAALVVYAVATRLAGRPLIAKDVYVPPVVLIGIGLHGLLKLDLTALDLFWLTITAVIGVVFGALRAATTRVFPKDGVLWQRYTWKTLVVWAVTFAISFGVGALALAAGMREEVRSIPLSIGVGLLGEALVILARSRAAAAPLKR
ncbi:MAG: DUF1453 domain-containing protein [Nonomuraea sp.]|nr:DUF1453 domain-containing protein [Nonomuraea sp.]NUP61749.1 DUF1453 domain-containing protein [Nonomuraea sp.]NUP78445.1 DUF1453 domain-containing protein [Nonomuraea sp.]NUS07980.1 DUF1453 domain-containing protein [Nonomuraea sp.]